MKCFISLLVLLSPIFLTCCQYENEDNLEICDTTKVTFSGTVLPIMQTNCYSCHSASTNENSANGNNLEGYANVKIYVDAGLVLCNIQHAGTCIHMPYNRPKLKKCDIAKIEAWIKRGYPND